METKRTQIRQGIKTDYLVNKIARLEQLIRSGKSNKDFDIELIEDFKEYNIQTNILIEDMESDNFYLKSMLEKKDAEILRLEKLLELLGVSPVELMLSSDEAVEYLWKNADKKNVDNIHALTCLIRQAKYDGVEIKTPEDLKNYLKKLYQWMK